MQITKIKKCKNGQYQLETDVNDEKYLLSEDLVITHNFLTRKQLTDEDVQLLHTLANYSKIYAKTMNYISYKMRTEHEIDLYLAKQDCEASYKADIITKLKKLNYINDHLYAELYLNQQLEFNKKGPLWIKHQLFQKGINQKIIDTVMKSVSTSLVSMNVKYLIENYDKMNKNKSVRKLKETITRNLLTKGYDLDIIKDSLNQHSFTSETAESQLLNKQLEKTYTKYKQKYQDYELKSRVIKSLMNKGFIYSEIEQAFDNLIVEG